MRWMGPSARGLQAPALRELVDRDDDCRDQQEEPVPLVNGLAPRGACSRGRATHAAARATAWRRSAARNARRFRTTRRRSAAMARVTWSIRSRMLLRIERSRSRSNVAVPASAKSSSSPTSPVMSDWVASKDASSSSRLRWLRARSASPRGWPGSSPAGPLSNLAGRTLRLRGAPGGPGGCTGFLIDRLGRRRGSCCGLLAPACLLGRPAFLGCGRLLGGRGLLRLQPSSWPRSSSAGAFLAAVFFGGRLARAVVFFAAVFLAAVFLTGSLLSGALLGLRRGAGSGRCGLLSRAHGRGTIAHRPKRTLPPVRRRLLFRPCRKPLYRPVNPQVSFPELEGEVAALLEGRGHLRALPASSARASPSGSSTRARRRRTTSPASTTSRLGSSRTSSVATRRCGATTSPGRRAGTATGSRSRSRSRKSSGITNKRQIEDEVGIEELRRAVPRVGAALRRRLGAVHRSDRLLGRPRRGLLDDDARLRRDRVVAAQADLGQGPARGGLQGRPLLPPLRDIAVATTSSTRPTPTRPLRTRPSTSGSHSRPTPTPRCSCGRRRRGRCLRTWPPPCTRTSSIRRSSIPSCRAST